MNLSKKYSAIIIGWFAFSNFIAYAMVTALIGQATPNTSIKYSVFASKPLLAPSFTESLQGSDSRAAIIDQYFAKYKCPLTGAGKKMVELADKYNFPFWWLPSIAWQESTCGKQLPKNSNNPFGYGIYGDKIKRFESLDQAMESVAWDLATHYFNKGLTEPCEVEKVYTPPSKGSWCNSIKFFRDEMLDYKSP
ncbi:hypothetical protein HY419_01990 [candidate division WWE3 bacterium]|nr:hypothetical protein [candidate division WWE3 bacterium]